MSLVIPLVQLQLYFVVADLSDNFCSCKMARKSLTAEEYMNSLSDEEFDDPKMTFIIPEPDVVRDEEEMDDSFSNRNIDGTSGDPEI
ncbi:hypothetical protein HNY73_004052 [Argiope bruennichi]|uniref:Uncharacterized protein n=1 Tax=Argiope bruennichi TaxID=94029 RepID=A0A8T0FSI1_ARGBR|nr:hypothetical protein HNY73_004052 [Argiope bruennichi]